MKYLDEIRDPKPRLKPGITYFRLFVFLVVAAALSVIALNVASGTYPSRDNCVVKGIDSSDLGDGTCTEGEATLVVVDRQSTLKLETLEAKLLAVRYEYRRRPESFEGRGRQTRHLQPVDQEPDRQSGSICVDLPLPFDGSG